MYTLWSIPFMGILTVVMFMLEVRGHSQLYDSFNESQLGMYLLCSTVHAIDFGLMVHVEVLLYNDNMKGEWKRTDNLNT